DPKGFARHFIYAEKDHLQFLIETQRDMDRPIYIVPQLILYRKTPEKDHSSLLNILFGFKENPGIIRKIALLFRYHRQTFIDFGTPLDLKSYLAGQPATRSTEEMTGEIRQMLIEDIDAQKRVILGPIMKSRQQLKEKVLKDMEIAKTIEDMAGGNSKRLKQYRKRAGEYFDEIAADYNIAYVQFFYMALTWLWKKIFQGIDVQASELSLVREWARKGSLIYVPSHKSHIDYLAFNYVLNEHHMHVPRIAAGKNLAFWPMGHIFRKSGAFFIRRSFKGTRLYPKIFSKYIKVLIEEGHPIEFYIEGGRSRSGKLVFPKTGFLSILLRAHQEGYCDDLVFVPASISYDRIPEEKSYLKELGGRAKKDENFKQVLTARRLLKRKYGKIYIRFGQPLSLERYLTQKGAQQNEIHQSLAFHLIQSINRVTLVTPLALVASVILTKHRRGFQSHELVSTAQILLDFLKKHEIPTATTLNHFQKTVGETISLLVNRKIVSLLEDVDGQETFYYVDEDKKPWLEYYKNSIIHYFIPHAFVAVSLLTGQEEIKTQESILIDYSFLKNIFKNEFVYDDDKEPLEEIKGVTACFLDSSFITQNDGNRGYKVTRLGFDKLPIWAGLAKTFLESYWVATRSLIQQGNKAINTDKMLKHMNYIGLRFHKLGLIDHVEAMSQLNFRNALSAIKEESSRGQGQSDEANSQTRERLSRLGQRLYELSRYRT
ncbi:MAG: 1-acyl-sn-glycerol-3-phosphate acyltransferase, partial [Thermodesulfobacteriota bacterium]|nr:1-acyl-sn-glycerol-3-phosphate acyltransferase [Thermodesulfobacteriota bacterium]